MRWGSGTIVALSLISVLCTCDRAAEEAPAPLFKVRQGTGVNNINELRPTESLNIVEYLYYYNGGGVAATDISGDGLPDLYFTNNQRPNAYFINEGNWRFRDATEEAGVAGAGQWSTGVSVTDVNADGLPDIYVCNVDGYKGLSGKNELFVQQSDGTFQDRAANYGLDFGGFNTQAYWFDYDLDGDEDVYLLRHSVHNDATYRDAAEREVPDSLAGDRLLRNEGESFRDVTRQMGLYSSRIGYGLSAAVADFDGNGYPDIYVCNDFSENDYYYLNRAGETFEEVIRERTGHTSNFSMGSDVGDLDNDGRPDLVTLDMRPENEEVLKATVSAEPYNLYRLKRRAGYHDQLPRNNVQWNRGGGNFSEIGEMSGLAATDWSWSVLIEDFDLDGTDEIFVANGIERRPNDLDYLKFISSAVARKSSNLAVAEMMPSGHVPNVVFKRDTALRYRPVEWGLSFHGSTTGAATADFDGDGDPDLVINNVNAPAILYENTVRDGHRKQPDSAASNNTQGLKGGLRAPGARDAVTRAPFMMARQRGFLSQSDYAGPGTRARGVPATTADSTAYAIVEYGSDAPISVPGADNTFDRDPLQPFPGAVPDGKPEYTLQVETADLRVEAGMWLPIRIGRRVDGQWAYEVVEGTRGWWQSLAIVGEAGREEILAGNWGWNSSLGEPTSAEPLRLYLVDVDGNGRRDPLITYVRGGKEYTLADKDELAGQFPAWRRNNLSYADFSRRGFRENFPNLEVEPLQAENLAHVRIVRNTEGEWAAQSLPVATQLTPINSILPTPSGYLLAGNKLDVLPRVGRQDAAALQLLRPDGRVEFIDLGPGYNHREARHIRIAGRDRYRIDFADGAWVVLRLP
ncbi:FG-GAP repeat domain-containing protein [Neolewinella litorea]|uniref:VCBS repeat-containing protein n=1 Tax=Neolewinella litorea TaxID=2562452 RepID=A0A4S4NR19_9BACT|nr:VCBS repeat-containing protein [Neolewinella litorea]THH41625.1 VCBS repeat-containing protein [Neolewinella litorea]